MQNDRKLSRNRNSSATTFAECCNLWIETHKSAWKGDGRGGSQMLNAKLLLFTHGKALKLTRIARPLEPIS